jgi:IS5 family transposase
MHGIAERAFAGLDLHASVPDETTHCRFRNALVVNGVYDDLLAEICRQLEEHGLKVREAEAAIIDATLIASAARPRSHVEGIAEDRAEDETPPDPPDIRHSADPDATWVKKGRKSTLGYKGFARVDEEGVRRGARTDGGPHGSLDKSLPLAWTGVHVTPANVAESPEFETMIEGANGQRVLADKSLPRT